MKNPTLARFGRATSITLAAFCLLLAATGARAACGEPSGKGVGISPKIPFLKQLDPESASAGGETAYDSIVGMWHVTYTAGGQTFYESFDQWHSDGTEFEFADIPTITGDVCMGVWKQIGTHSIRLHHTGWTFDTNGSVSGTMVLDETNTLGPAGLTYQGSFDLKFYDLDGSLKKEVEGQLKATRIVVD
jgi:hypothetical protein